MELARRLFAWRPPRDGSVYVCDRENSRIQVFTAEGKFVSQWRDIRKPTDIYFNKQQVAYAPIGSCAAPMAPSSAASGPERL